MTNNTGSIIKEITSAIFIFLFSYTGISKLFSLEKFRFTLQEFPFMSKAAPTLSLLIPLVEIFISVLLLIPQYKKVGLWSSLALMILFTSFLVYMISYSSNLPCSCAGIINDLSWSQHIFLNLFFIGLAATTLLINKKRKIVAG
jgi:hypothetical protein